MQEKSIEASYIWSEDEFIAGARSNRRAQDGPVLKFGVPFLIAVTGAGGLVGLYLGRQWIGFWSICMPLIGFGSICLLLMCMLVYIFYLGGMEGGYRRAFRRKGFFAQPDQKATFLINDRGIRLLLPGVEVSYIWELVSQVRQVRDGFLITFGGLPRWLPNHAFRDEDDRDAFIELASRRALKFVQKL